MKRFLSLGIFALFPSAGNGLEICSIRVDGLLYHYGECFFNEEIGSDHFRIVRVGERVDGDTLGYWVWLGEQEGGSYEGFWNQYYGATHAHTELGKLEKKDDCWISENAQICLGVSVRNVPSYLSHAER